MTRQSAHILMASIRLLFAGNIQCRPSSFAAILSIVLLTPNDLLQRMQSAGSSSLMIFVRAVGAVKSICGFSVMTFSGQVLMHSPHWTQASSTNLSAGRSGSSRSAPVGHTDTQDRHSVQPSRLTLIVPTGAPSGSEITSVGAGARRCSSLKAKRSRSRRLPTVLKVAGGLTVAAGSIPRSASPSESGSSVSIVATRRPENLRPERMASAIATVCERPAMSRKGLARRRKRTLAAP